MARAFLNRVGTAVPAFDIHAEFVDFARTALADRRSRALFERMVALADIEHRYAILEPGPLPRDRFLDKARFYQRGAFPSTGARLALYEQAALPLACEAVRGLGIEAIGSSITHLVLASCTGFAAPGLDLELAATFGLPRSIERTIVGFMGCYAAVSALKLARHIVRSEPEARVLVVNLEISSVHLQEDWGLETMLMFLLFGDGCGACLVSAEPSGIELGPFRASLIPRTEQLITWRIRDQGFDMRLSGQVPGRIRRWLGDEGPAALGVPDPAALPLWAIHAGGRSVLDAVQHGLRLPPAALGYSRGVLRDYGNMSSATLIFVLDRILRQERPELEGRGGEGMAVAFGPGLSVESFRFQRLAEP